MKPKYKQRAGGSGPPGTTRLTAWAGLALLLAGLFSASAQDYKLGSFSAKTGSGVPASDDYVITGGINLGILVAAEDEDHVTGGGITGGSLVVVTIDGIRLTIRFIPGGVEVSWPQEAEDYVLEGTANLSAPDWQPIATTPPQNSEASVLVVPIAEAAQFYRLRRVSPD